MRKYIIFERRRRCRRMCGHDKLHPDVRTYVPLDVRVDMVPSAWLHRYCLHNEKEKRKEKETSQQIEVSSTVNELSYFTSLQDNSRRGECK